MSSLNTYSIIRQNEQCLVVAPDGVEFIRLKHRLRPAVNLLLACIVGFFFFIFAIIAFVFCFAVLFGPAGQVPGWHLSFMLTVSALSGFFAASFILKKPGYTLKCNSGSYSIDCSDGGYRLLTSDGVQIAAFDSATVSPYRRSLRKKADQQTPEILAVDTSSLPRSLRTTFRFALSLLVTIASFAGLYLVLVVFLEIRLTMGLLITQLVTGLVLWMSKFSNPLESTVDVFFGEERAAEINHSFGNSTCQMSETASHKNSQTEFLCVLLAVLVYL